MCYSTKKSSNAQTSIYTINTLYLHIINNNHNPTVNNNMNSLNIVLVVLTLLFSSPSHATMDPDSIYDSFLQCRNLSSDVVYSSTANTSAYTTVLQATGRASFIAHFLGDSDRLVALMDKNFPELGLKKEDCIEVSWIESVLYWANFDLNTTSPEILLDRHSGNVNFGKRKSDYVQTVIPESGITSIFNKLVELGRVGFVFNPYGGKMYEIAADATPFPHRAGNLYKIQYSVNWNDPDPELEANYLNQSRVMYEFMTPFVSKNPRGAFLNYRDLDIGVMSGDGKNSYSEGEVYGEKYFMGNFERLVKIKTAVDPDNFFRNEQSIPTLAGKTSGKSRKMK
ncbi:putative cannabidiolic acid synthase [Helianthus debilis subsp. tardiflorus]